MRDYDEAADRRSDQDWRRYAALWRLAWPAMLSRAGILLMSLVDIVMVGHYSRLELAYASLGVSLFIPIMVTGVGLMVGVMTLVSQASGRGPMPPIRCMPCGWTATDGAWREMMPEPGWPCAGWRLRTIPPSG